jgi:S-DNA-T family DNA segregation ATPase FtsK/SpoIIIE
VDADARADVEAGTADRGGDADIPSGVLRARASPREGRAGELTPQGRLRESATDDPAFVWALPDAGSLLTRSSGGEAKPDTAGQEQTAAALLEALGHFAVQATVIGTVAGPHITRFELRLAPGTKMSKVATLTDDVAYALAATDIRILAPIPGKQAVGVEVPNAKRRIVRLGDVFQEPPKDWSPLTVWLGKDVAGKAIGADLAKMPHLLVAGTTGAGKSGAINAMLASVLLRATPREVRLVLVDPKQVELNHYESIPHLLTNVITSPRMAANALGNLVREMEQRYGIMSMARTRGLVELNRARAARREAPLPYILCVIDELADLMMVAPTDVEDSIIRLAQKARAVGIHLVLATQSPRVDVITGMIKANVPSRIAFAVSSQTDSRVILDQNGAESLLGQGDMLFSPVGTSRLQRIQGAYIDEPQIARLTDHWRRQGEPELREELLEEIESDSPAGGGDEFDPDEDPLLADAITLVAEMQTASTSMLQRRLRLGYTRAGRVIDMLERRGVISGYEGSKPRTVLITEADLPRVLAALAEPAASTSD